MGSDGTRDTPERLETELDRASSSEGLMRELMDTVAGQAGAQQLARALALAEGFGFFIAVCKTSRIAAALQQWLEETQVFEEQAPREVVRISPYPLDPLAAGPTTLAYEELAATVTEVLSGLVASGPGEGGERLVLLDASRASDAVRELWLELFKRLNERRNALSRGLGGVLVLLVPEGLEGGFAQAAPDLWSIRSGRVVVDEPPRQRSVGRELVHAHNRAYGNDEDPRALALELERQRAQAGSPSSARALRVLLLRLAGAHQRLGHLDESLAHIDEAAEISARLGDDQALAACWLARSNILRQRGELEQAQSLVGRAIERLGDDEWTLAGAHGQLADILQARGELDEALRIRREEELPVYERLGDVRARAVTMGRVADILQARGELDEALRIRREEQLPVYERLGDVRERAVTMGKVADILEARGELDEALRMRREEQLPVYERLGDVRSRAVTMGKVAGILEARGELDEALRIRREEELPVYERLGDVRGLVVGRAHLALGLLRRGTSEDVAEAVELLGRALRDARRLRIPVAGQLEQFIRQRGLDPDGPPSTDGAPAEDD